MKKNNVTQKEYRNIIEETAVHPEGTAVFIQKGATKKQIEQIDGEDLKQILLGNKETDCLPVRTADIGRIYGILGLLGEAGEVAEKQKKVLRGDSNPASPYSELNDVRWYVENLARLAKKAPGQLEAENAQKILDRKERDVVKGSGDKR